MANIPLAFLEPTIAKWMEDVMDATPFQKGFGGPKRCLLIFNAQAFSLVSSIYSTCLWRADMRRTGE